MENFTYIGIRLEMFGWTCIYIQRERERERERETDRQTDRQTLALNNLQGFNCHKIQPTNQPTNHYANIP